MASSGIRFLRQMKPKFICIRLIGREKHGEEKKTAHDLMYTISSVIHGGGRVTA